MKFLRIDLLTLLISLFILGGCKSADTIGLPVDPSNSLQTTLIDTATITAVTVPDDSVATTNLTKTPLAYFKDPILGVTEANIAAALNLPGSSAYSLPAGTIVVDSAVIGLRYADGFYGDSLSTSYKVNVYQLSEQIKAQTYYNNKAWSTNSTVLGTTTFFPRPKTGFKINSIVAGAADTQIVVKPQLRIKINPSFVAANFFNAGSAQLTTNSVFQSFIKGLYFTLDKTRPGVGGTMFFTVVGDTTNLDVYYRTIASDGTIDTAKVSLPLGTTSAAQIKHDYSTAASGLTAQLSNAKASYSTLYLQGLSGLRAKISFPYLKKILAAQGGSNNVVLNRAELVVTPVAGTQIPFVPTPRLTMYRYDIALQRQLIPDAYTADLHYISYGTFGGYYDHYQQSYHYIITGYVEDLMRGTLVDYGTYLSPTDTAGTSTATETVSITNTAQVAARSIVGGNSNSAYKMKLNILFNKISK